MYNALRGKKIYSRSNAAVSYYNFVSLKQLRRSCFDWIVCVIIHLFFLNYKSIKLETKN